MMYGPNGCPDLLAGPNCTLTWREFNDPAATVITYILILLYGLSLFFVLLTFFKEFQGKSLREVPSVSFYTSTSALISVSCWFVFFCLGGNLVYPLKDWRGKLCVFSLMVAGAFYFQSTNLLAVNYMSALNHRLRKTGLLNIETIELKWLKFFAVPWPFHIACLVAIILILIDDSDPMAYVITAAYGFVLYALFIAITLNAYYYRKFGNMLQAVVKSHESMGEVGGQSNIDLDEWKSIAKYSRLFAYYAFTVGAFVFMINLIFLSLNWLSDPFIYFVFQFYIVGFGIWGSIFLLNLRDLKFLRNNACTELCCPGRRQKPQKRLSRFNELA